MHPQGTHRCTEGAPETRAASAVVGADGAIFVGSYDQHLYCLEPDGRVRWSVQTGVFPGYETGHPPGFVLSTPALSAKLDRVYFGATDRCVYAVHAGTRPELEPGTVTRRV